MEARIPFKAEGEFEVSLDQLCKRAISDLWISLQSPSDMRRVLLLDLLRRKILMDADGEVLFHWAKHLYGPLPFSEGVVLPTITAFSREVTLPPDRDLRLEIEGDFEGELIVRERVRDLPEPSYLFASEDKPFMFCHTRFSECGTPFLPVVDVLFETLVIPENPPSEVAIRCFDDEVTIPWEKVANSSGTALIPWGEIPLPRGLRTTTGWGREGILLASFPFGAVTLELKGYEGRKVKLLHIAGDLE